MDLICELFYFLLLLKNFLLQADILLDQFGIPGGRVITVSSLDLALHFKSVPSLELSLALNCILLDEAIPGETLFDRSFEPTRKLRLDQRFLELAFNELKPFRLTFLQLDIAITVKNIRK